MLKRLIRDGTLHLMRRVLGTDQGRDLLSTAVRGLDPLRAPLDLAKSSDLIARYADLGSAVPPAANALLPLPARDEGLLRRPIFITSRFRSGSTLLWNIFRHLPGCTAYYEPLNERRWFDAARRGERIDHTHQGVSDYWREYASLAELERYYDERWIDRRLYMDAAHWDAGLMHYIMRLIEAAPGRAALQFNRVDFRLPWLRRYFPQAAIVHLYRHPRAQWYSALMGERRCPRDVTPAQFAPYDELYLLRWCEDLKHQFPFLDPGEVRHPYELSYYLWKLSCLFGATYADLSLCFEELVSQPRKNLAILFDQLQLDTDQLDAVAHLVQQPAKERWRDYADGEWFATYERQCDLTLARFLGVSVSELTGHRATESVPRGG